MNLVPYGWKNPFTGTSKDVNRLFNRNVPSTDTRNIWDDDFFADFFAPSRMLNGGPAVDVSESDSEIFVRAELPGVEKDQIRVEVKNDYLVLNAEKQQKQEHKDRHAYHVESSYGRIQRTIALPVEVVSEKAQANYKNGVLEITLPKSENAKRRSIEVKIS